MEDYEKSMLNLLFSMGGKSSLQYAIIVLHLYNEGGMITTRQLATFLDKTPVDVMHIVRRLIDDGLLERQGALPNKEGDVRFQPAYGLTDKAIDILVSDDIFGYPE